MADEEVKKAPVKGKAEKVQPHVIYADDMSEEWSRGMSARAIWLIWSNWSFWYLCDGC